MVPRLTFDEVTHTYRVDGRVVASVTQILGAVFPNIYAGIPAEILARKAALGTAVHKMIELFMLGTMDWTTMHPSVEPYFESWFEWWARHELPTDNLKTENQFYSVAGDYCGTVDLEVVGFMPIDWKITSNKMPTHGLQLAGYAAALGYNSAAALYLKGDGKPAEFVEYNVAKLAPDWSSTLRVYHMMRKFQP